MAWNGNNTGAEFAAGHTPLANTGRGNDNSLTLGTDQGLEQTSERWNSLSPRGVLATTTGAASQDDGSYQDYMREQGSYQPGSMEQLQDHLSSGNDNQP